MYTQSQNSSWTKMKRTRNSRLVFFCTQFSFFYLPIWKWLCKWKVRITKKVYLSKGKFVMDCIICTTIKPRWSEQWKKKKHTKRWWNANWWYCSVFACHINFTINNAVRTCLTLSHGHYAKNAIIERHWVDEHRVGNDKKKGSKTQHTYLLLPFTWRDIAFFR